MMETYIQINHCHKTYAVFIKCMYICIYKLHEDHHKFLNIYNIAIIIKYDFN